MIYNKSKKDFVTETGWGKEWVERAWNVFLNEVYAFGNDTTKELFKEWKIAIDKNGVKWIAYPDRVMKANPKLKKECDLRNKLARITSEYRTKIDKVRKGK